MSLQGQALSHARTRFPRVSGDEPSIYWYWQTDNEFSPRERG